MDVMPIMDKMDERDEMEPLPNNTRFILELERKRLVQERIDLDEKWGSLSIIFVQTFQCLAILAYLFIILFLVFSKKIRSKINMLVTLWAFINLIVLSDRAIRFFNDFTTSEDIISQNGTAECQMLAGIGRLYASTLSLVWLYLKYFEKLEPKYNWLAYFLMLVPALVSSYFVFYFYNVDRYVYEVFGPGCDFVSLAIYLLVGFIFVMCKIFVGSSRSTSSYPLLISLSSLITNFPIGVLTIYLRFNLDISWSYRFHIYFIDLFVNLFTASNGFVAVFLVLLYHGRLSKILSGKLEYFD